MKILSWGANSYGQLSIGLISEQCCHPTESVILQEIVEVIKISAGGGHSLALNAEGTLFGCGSNNNGQLSELANNTSVFSKVVALQEFKLTQIECGWESSFAITEEGTVVAWGSNKFGQLGISKEKLTKSSKPIAVDLPKATQVAAGLRHTAVVTSAGHVYMCGSSNHGQLGILQPEGTVPKREFDSFVKVEALEDVLQVACGQHHTLALTAGGHLYGWGDNRRGQLGQGPPTQETPRQLMTCDSSAIVKAGWTHSALLTGGRVISWGRNCYGQLGHSYNEQQADTPRQVTGLHHVKQLELGSEHNIALLENGEIWSWGWNEHGNCGNGTDVNVITPQLIPTPCPIQQIAVGGGHNLALM